MPKPLPLLVVLLVALLLGPATLHAAGPRGITALAWQGEVLWLGSTQGLARWQSGETQAMEFPLAGRTVTALLPDGDSLWVGTRDGLARRDAGGAWTTWARGEQGLSSAWIAALARYDGEIVAGTFGGGVQRWDGTVWSPLGTDGPAQVTALAVDGDMLWAGSASGLWRWSNGVWATEPELATRINALHLSRDGTLWAGAEDGLHRLRGTSFQLVPPLRDQRVTALAEHDSAIIAATQAGLVDVSGTPLPDQPGGAISALATRDDQLAIGTLGGGLTLLPDQPATTHDLPPIVLVHGLDDSNQIEQSQLRFFPEWLGRDGYRWWYAPNESERPLLDNVALLRQTVAEARRATGQPQVILIAHSFGGLIARAYLDSGATDVMALATLGSPLAGARLVYDILLDDLPDASPAEIALLPEQVALLDPANAGDATPQLHIGGTRLPSQVLLADFPLSDGYVSAASATDAPGATRLLPLLHGWTLDSIGGGIESMTWPDTLYQSTLLPWMQAVARGEPWQDRATSPDLPAPGFTRQPLLDRTLAPGDAVTVEATVDGAPTTWLLEAEGVRTTLIAPDGTRYGDERLLITPTVARLPYEGFGAARFWSTRDRAGRWQVELRNESQQPHTVRLSLIRPDDPPLVIRAGDPVSAGDELTVRAVGPATLALEATLGDEQAPMREVAPGEYEATLRAPARWGYHRLRVGNGQVERDAVVIVRSQRFTLVDVSADYLTLSGEGQAALLLTLRDGTTRLVGPYRFRDPGEHRIALPPDTATWQLLDATRELIPGGDDRSP